MKTLKVIFVSVCCVFFAAALYAQHEPGYFASIKSNDDPKGIVIQLKDLNRAYTKITIMNDEGTIVWTKHVRGEDAYADNFIMEGMPPTDYLVQVSNRKGDKVRAVNLTDESIVVLPYRPAPTDRMNRIVSYRQGEEVRLVAYINPVAGERALNVQLTNLNKEPTLLNVVSLEGAPMIRKMIHNEWAFAKKLDLTNFGDGHYYLYVKNSKTSLWQLFTLSEEGVTLREQFYRDKATFEAIEGVVMLQ